MKSLIRRRRAALTGLTLMASALVVTTAPPAQAALITVAAGEVAVVDNNLCSLREAVDNANNDAQTHDDCATGTGPDTIQVPAGTYLLAPGGQLTLTDTDLTTISGAGAALTILDGGNTTRILEVAGATAAVADLTIRNGLDTCVTSTCQAAAGGILNAGTLILTQTIVTANTASCTADQCLAIGGGIRNVGTLTVTASTLSGNTATCTGMGCGAAGGGIANGSGPATVTNSTLSANTASCTSTGNIPCVAFGGGIDNVTGTVTLTASTLSANSATCTDNCAAFGGGIQNGQGTVIVEQTIVANSTGGNCTAPVAFSAYNLEDDVTCGFVDARSLTNVDPMLGPLADNGGPTPTHALLPGSPAIDAVPPADCVVASDQRGVFRPQGPACDIGAFELVVALPPPPPPPGGGAGGGGGADDDDDDGDGPRGRARITIVEDVRPERDVTFGFHTKNLKATTFRLTDDRRREFRDLKAGTYTVAQDTKNGWKLDGIVCKDPTRNTRVVLDTRRAVIKLGAGEHVTCTFTNKQR